MDLGSCQPPNEIRHFPLLKIQQQTTAVLAVPSTLSPAETTDTLYHTPMLGLSGITVCSHHFHSFDSYSRTAVRSCY